jgi:hypothetical protein
LSEALAQTFHAPRKTFHDLRQTVHVAIQIVHAFQKSDRAFEQTFHAPNQTVHASGQSFQQGSSMRCPEKRAIGKYNVSRRIDDSALAEQVTPVKLLAA